MTDMDQASVASRVENALEVMCFMMVDPIEPDGSLEDELAAAVTFGNDDVAGEVWLRSTPGFLVEAASALLGVEPEEVELPGDAMATLLELANVVGGEVVDLLGGTDDDIHLGLPSEGAGAPEGTSEWVTSAFDSMGEVFVVEVRRKEQV